MQRQTFLLYITHFLYVFFQTNQFSSPVISVPDESSESSSQIILTSENKVLGIPTNTYCVLAENQKHFIDKTQEKSDLKKIIKEYFIAVCVIFFSIAHALNFSLK